MATSPKKGHDAIIGDITGASSALKADISPTVSIPWEGVTYTAAEVEGQFDGLVALYQQATTAKDAAATAIAAWNSALPEAKAMWKTYVDWVGLTYGKDDATSKKFNIPVKAPKAKPTAEQQAVRNAKYRAAVQQRRAAKAAAAPKVATVVAYDADGNPIGGPPAAGNQPVAATPAVAK